jgi:hypothetical protein
MTRHGTKAFGCNEDQCDPSAAAKIIGWSSVPGARSVGPKSELNPITARSNKRSTYRMSTPFVAPARLVEVEAMISLSGSGVKEARFG